VAYLGSCLNLSLKRWHGVTLNEYMVRRIS
jgi:hypothetical protein